VIGEGEEPVIGEGAEPVIGEGAEPVIGEGADLQLLFSSKLSPLAGW